MKEMFCGAEYISDAENYVVFDIETTGLHGAEIVDFAAMKIREGQIVDCFRTYVKPKNRIPASVSAINGITDEMLLKEANRLIKQPQGKPRRNLRLYGPIWALGGALVTGMLWILTVVV